MTLLPLHDFSGFFLIIIMVIIKQWRNLYYVAGLVCALQFSSGSLFFY